MEATRTRQTSAAGRPNSTRRHTGATPSRLTLSLPSSAEAHTLWAFVEAMGWKKYVVEETPAREDILSQCCGAWADDSRTTEEIIASARSAFSTGIIRETAVI